MAKRKQRAARIASVALLGSTVFANPPPSPDKKPSDVIVNRPNPAYDKKPVDAGTVEPEAAPRPVILNQVSPRPPPTINRMPVPREEHLLLPDGGSETRLKK
ncbi:MAG: hypothetical protein GQE15_17545 [Archangiaceae bacterium]|nr:hypothetical protein [Archangiaceae bacterium]